MVAYPLPDFCQLAAGLASWDIPDSQPQQLSIDAGKRFSPGGKFGCGSPEARCFLGKLDFYVCPKDGRSQSTAGHCGGLESLYCSAWDVRPLEMLTGDPVLLGTGSLFTRITIPQNSVPVRVQDPVAPAPLLTLKYYHCFPGTSGRAGRRDTGKDLGHPMVFSK